MTKIRFSIGLGLGIAALLLVGLFFLPQSLDSHGELSVVSTVITLFSSKPRSQKISFRSIKAKLHGELEAKSLGAPGTCVAELVFNTSLTGFVLFDLQLEAWILDGVGVEQDGREEMELVQKLEKRDR
ncbi:hypothetical protein YC2023_061165 [Brassica napus]